MAIGISFKFISGRYHATPWGRHPNEGIPEWPVSPWRILRAIIATWKRKLDNKLGCSNEYEMVKQILMKLSCPPDFYLPPAFIGSCRYYMRWYKRGPEDKTKVFDNFIVIKKDEPVVVLWENVVLTEEEFRILSNIVSNINYLGRSESLCEAELLGKDKVEQYKDMRNCIILNEKVDASKYDIVNVLCCDGIEAFKSNNLPKISEKRLEEKILYDPAWHICIETLDLHRERWSQPPGSKWVLYLRPKNCFTISHSKKLKKSEKKFHIARYAIDSNVLPLVQDTLQIAELARYSIMGIYGRLFKTENGEKGKSEIFSGKDAQGNKLEGHNHAFYLPVDEDCDGKLDHLNIYIPGGYSEKELKALFNFRKIKRLDSSELRLVLLSVCKDEELNRFIFAKDTEWISATPFISVRFPKKNGTKRDSPEILSSRVSFLKQVLKEELFRLFQRRDDIPDISKIEIVPVLDENGVFRLPYPPFLRPIQYKRHRMRKKDDGVIRQSGYFKLKFPEEVKGPICLGHLSHFGMGLFLPINNMQLNIEKRF